LSLRGVVTAFALLAFVLASFVTQTHIHIPAAPAFGSGATTLAKTDAGKAGVSRDRDQQPGAPADDPAHCPLCQEFLVAGAYVAPAPIDLPLPMLTAVVTPSLIQSIGFIRTATHSWLSRAPPLA
jgi:hypothetical protein